MVLFGSEPRHPNLHYKSPSFTRVLGGTGRALHILRPPLLRWEDGAGGSSWLAPHSPRGKQPKASRKKPPCKSSSSELEWRGEGKSLVSEAGAGERALHGGICFSCHGSEGIHSPTCLSPAPPGLPPSCPGPSTPF